MNLHLLRAAQAELQAALDAPDDATEAGRVFSAKNEAQLRAIATAAATLLQQLTALPEDQPDQAQPPQAQPVAVAVPAVQQQAAEAPVESVAQESVQPISEAAIKDGKSLIRIITPGWGSSGYYAPGVLERDAPVAFPAGTKMYWDHPTEEEAKKRPERSLRDLAAELTEDARWMPQGPEGPGVYSRARVFKSYQPAVEELAPHIGVSIRAAALMRNGEAEGKRGPIVERLLGAPTNSVDFVTIPGRGGRIASLFEAARGRNEDSEGIDMDELTTLREALAKAEQERDEERARADRAGLALAMREARDVATEAVGTDIPTAARDRIIESVAKDPPMKDGVLDRETLTEAATKAAADEKAYLASVLGTGTVRGMGSGTTTEAAAPDMTADFQRLGLSESAAKTAASGRTN